MPPFPSDNTAMPNKSFLRSAGSLANAFPMALRSLHNDPVGIEKELGIWQKWVSVNFGWFFIVAFVRVTPHEA